MAASITITVKGHWVSAWFLRMAATPFIRIDGVETPAEWGRPCTVEVRPGHHTVAAGIKYGSASRLLGALDAPVAVVEGQHLVLRARNGLVNSSPFRVRPNTMSSTT